MNAPHYIELDFVPDVISSTNLFADVECLLLFESVRKDERLGRYSFLCADPIRKFVTSAARYGEDPFAEVESLSQELKCHTIPDLPPFQGGFAGMLGYELGGCWEQIPQPQHDELYLPVAVIGLFDWVIAWDHFQQKTWAFSHGFAKDNLSRCPDRARETCQRLKQIISSAAPKSPHLREQKQIIDPDQNHQFVSNFSAKEYAEAVQKVIDYIGAGDIFQANLSQRFEAEINHHPLDIYQAFRIYNPAPFAGYLQCDDWAIVSSSPERFIQKENNRVWTRPIKGTRQRQTIPEADLYTRDELRESEKDQSENVMIVDLLRNDLSRVCQPGTIRVPELCTVEAYETVTHLVSEVTGTLRAEKSFWDVMRATFPGGSITGAPKIRAMEIITELEQVARGPYCGSLFYHGLDGTADSNILIRTLTKRGNQAYFPAGGGIVWQSHPQGEYEETLHKSAGMRAALASLIELQE